MNTFQRFFKKLLALLRVRTFVAGLEIGDDILRLTYLAGHTWQLYAVRLEPGVLEAGVVKDKDKFIAALMSLKTGSKISGGNKNKKVNVVVSMSSAHIYSQVFNLPTLTGGALVKAVDLNLQMASPQDVAKSYSGWEVVGKDASAGRIDVMGSFIDREIIDSIVGILATAGFLVMAIEPRSIALTRILREKGAGVDTQKSYLFLDVDNIGIDFLVIRNGLPYFEYTNLWKDIAGPNGEISVQKFEEELAASLRQVTNFYNQHWGDPIGAVIIAATTLNDSIEKTVAATVTFPAVRLTLEMGQQISSEWLVAIGCSLREIGSKTEAEEVSLLGMEWEDRFQQERIFQFTRFWEVLMPMVFVILILVFSLSDRYVYSTRAALEAQPGFNLNSDQTAQIVQFEASTTQFNTLVSLAQAAEDQVSKKYVFLGALQTVMQSDGITLGQLSDPGGGGVISFNGTATSEDRVVAFETDLENAPGFSNVVLPLTAVQDNGGSYAFQMTFEYANQ